MDTRQRRIMASLFAYLSQTQAYSHLIEALIQSKFGIFTHLGVCRWHIIFRDCYFGFIITQIFEGHNRTYIPWKLGWHPYLGRVDLVTILICQILDEFYPLQRHDFLIYPGAVHILSAEILGRTHADN